MPEIQRKYDPEFREGAVRIVRETGKTVAEVADDLGIHAGTLRAWVSRDRRARGDKGRRQEGGRRLRAPARARERRAADGA